MTRVIHVTTVPQTATSFLVGQLSYLEQHGYRVSLVTSPGDGIDQFAEQEGIYYDIVPMRRSIAPMHDLLSLRRLVRLFRRLRPQIVHGHTPKAGLLSMLAAKACRVPVRIYQLHGLRYETACGWQRSLLKGTELTACRAATGRLCVSPSLKAAAVRGNLFREAEASVLQQGSANGVDAAKFAPDRTGVLRRQVRRRFGIPEDAILLGFIGRLVKDKGIIELHEAWQQLRREFPQLHLMLVGPFESGDAVPSEQRAALEADPRVHLAGVDWCARPYYAAMDVFVLPSHREGLGVVLLEAAAMELPTIATRVTGCLDAVADGKTGTLVPLGSIAQLVSAVRRYVNEPALRCQHGEAGRQRVIQEFRSTAIWSSLADYYAQSLQQYESSSSQLKAA